MNKCASERCLVLFDPPKNFKKLYCSERCKRRESKRRWRGRYPDKFASALARAWKRKYSTSEAFRVECRIRLATSIFLNPSNRSPGSFMEAVSGLSKREFIQKFPRADGIVVDHIVPIDAFDLTNPEHVVRACFWKNIQMITDEQNRLKSNRHDCRDVMLLPWSESDSAMAAARRMITQCPDRWLKTDWSKTDAEIAEYWGLSIKIVNDRRRDKIFGRCPFIKPV